MTEAETVKWLQWLANHAARTADILERHPRKQPLDMHLRVQQRAFKQIVAGLSPSPKDRKRHERRADR